MYKIILLLSLLVPTITLSQSVKIITGKEQSTTFDNITQKSGDTLCIVTCPFGYKILNSYIKDNSYQKKPLIVCGKAYGDYWIKLEKTKSDIPNVIIMVDYMVSR